MYNPVTNAVQEIERTIPKQILTEVFGREDFRNWRRNAPVTIDEMIKSKVIRPTVIKDCNLIGGRIILLSLEGAGFDLIDQFTTVYNVPVALTGNREIVSVLSVHYLPALAMSGGPAAPFAMMSPTSVSDVQTAAQRVGDAASNIPHVSSAEAELIGYNTVMIRDSMRSTQIYGLRCVIAHDENLANLSPRSYRHFAKACILATKSYIYNQLVIRMDQGRLEQGQELGRFKDIVDQYADSEEMYQDYIRNVLRKVLFMNDTTSHDRFIRLQVNPSL